MLQVQIDNDSFNRLGFFLFLQVKVPICVTVDIEDECYMYYTI